MGTRESLRILYGIPFGAIHTFTICVTNCCQGQQVRKVGKFHNFTVWGLVFWEEISLTVPTKSVQLLL